MKSVNILRLRIVISDKFCVISAAIESYIRFRAFGLDLSK